MSNPELDSGFDMLFAITCNPIFQFYRVDNQEIFEREEMKFMHVKLWYSIIAMVTIVGGIPAILMAMRQEFAKEEAAAKLATELQRWQLNVARDAWTNSPADLRTAIEQLKPDYFKPVAKKTPIPPPTPEKTKTPTATPQATEEEAAQWSCPTCTYLNGPNTTVCDMCGTARPQEHKEPEKQPSSKTDPTEEDKYPRETEEKKEEEAAKVELPKEIQAALDTYTQATDLEDFGITFIGHELTPQQKQKIATIFKQKIPNLWYCTNCGTINGILIDPCTTCPFSRTGTEVKAKSFPIGINQWSCSNCKKQNKKESFECEQCHQSRWTLIPFFNANGTLCGPIAGLQIIISALDQQAAQILSKEGNDTEKKIGKLILSNDPNERNDIANSLIIDKKLGIPSIYIKKDLPIAQNFVNIMANENPNKPISWDRLFTIQQEFKDYTGLYLHSGSEEGGHFFALIKIKNQWYMVEQVLTEKKIDTGEEISWEEHIKESCKPITQLAFSRENNSIKVAYKEAPNSDFLLYAIAKKLLPPPHTPKKEEEKKAKTEKKEKQQSTTPPQQQQQQPLPPMPPAPAPAQSQQKTAVSQQEKEYNAAFDALKAKLNDLYATSETQKQDEKIEAAIDLAWKFRQATDTLYRARHPNALQAGIDAALEFNEQNFNDKIASLKPKDKSQQRLYEKFDTKLTNELLTPLKEAIHDINQAIKKSGKVVSTLAQTFKGKLDKIQQHFLPIEIEISLNQFNQKHPGVYQQIIGQEKHEEEKIAAPAQSPEQETINLLQQAQDAHLSNKMQARDSLLTQAAQQAIAWDKLLTAHIDAEYRDKNLELTPDIISGLINQHMHDPLKKRFPDIYQLFRSAFDKESGEPPVQTTEAQKPQIATEVKAPEALPSYAGMLQDWIKWVIQNALRMINWGAQVSTVPANQSSLAPALKSLEFILGSHPQSQGILSNQTLFDYQTNWPEPRANGQQPSPTNIIRRIVQQNAKICFMGDIHGSLGALIRNLLVLQDFKFLDATFKITDPNNLMVFTGDYISRGKHSIGVIYTLLLLVAANPNQVILLRGNHEDPNISIQPHYDNIDQLKNLYFNGDEAKAKDFFQTTLRFNFFDRLPIALLLGVQAQKGINWIQSCHGGIDPAINFNIFLNYDHSKAQLKRDNVFTKKPYNVANTPLRGVYDKAFANLNNFLPKKPDLIEGFLKNPNHNGFIWSEFCDGIEGYLNPSQESINLFEKPYKSQDIGGIKTGSNIAAAAAQALGLVGFIRGHQHDYYGLKIGGEIKWDQQGQIKTGDKLTGIGNLPAFKFGDARWPILTLSTASEAQGIDQPYDSFIILDTNDDDYKKWMVNVYERVVDETQFWRDQQIRFWAPESKFKKLEEPEGGKKPEPQEPEEVKPPKGQQEQFEFWTCPACGNQEEKSLTKCSRCGDSYSAERQKELKALIENIKKLSGAKNPGDVVARNILIRTQQGNMMVNVNYPSITLDFLNNCSIEQLEAILKHIKRNPAHTTNEPTGQDIRTMIDIYLENWREDKGLHYPFSNISIRIALISNKTTRDSLFSNLIAAIKADKLQVNIDQLTQEFNGMVAAKWGK